MSPPFYSEMLFPYQRSYDVKHNPKTITAVRASDRQIWTFQAQAATGCCLCMPEASAQHNTSRRHHVLWPCPARLAFRAANVPSMPDIEAGLPGVQLLIHHQLVADKNALCKKCYQKAVTVWQPDKTDAEVCDVGRLVLRLWAAQLLIHNVTFDSSHSNQASFGTVKWQL